MSEPRSEGNKDNFHSMARKKDLKSLSWGKGNPSLRSSTLIKYAIAYGIYLLPPFENLWFIHKFIQGRMYIGSDFLVNAKYYLLKDRTVSKNLKGQQFLCKLRLNYEGTLRDAHIAPEQQDKDINRLLRRLTRLTAALGCPRMRFRKIDTDQ